MWGNKVEKCLGTTIEFMNFAILTRINGIVAPVLVKNGEEEGAMMKSAILDGVVQFRNLKMALSRFITC